MGRDTARRAQEEDVTHEEAAPADGRQSVEGCHRAEQMLGVREDEESTRAVSVLCAG